MSGIAGFFLRDGAPAIREELACMAKRLQHRGPDRTQLWLEGSVGLLNCMLWITPESLSEHIPAVSSVSGVVVTSDARLDNRDDLISELGIEGTKSEITDSDLLLAAYNAWGEKCPSKLIGDFAFVIWDPRRQKLFMARDPMGIKCIYYFASPRLFAFASEIKALTCLRGVPKRLNETRVADFLINLFEDREITFYQDVNRLPAASTLSVTRESLRIETYWRLDGGKELRLSSDAEYAEGFRDLFEKAVQCRIRSAYPIASTLSGGLDSSSVACVAERQMRTTGQGTLHTLSAIFPSASSSDLAVIDERRFMNAALATGEFTPHFIHADKLSPLRQVNKVHYHLDEANSAPNLYMHWAMFEEAQKNGVRVVLDGFDGDTTVSHGYQRLPDLFRSMRWGTLARELTLARENLVPNGSRKRLFWNMCVKPLAPIWAFRLNRLLKGRLHEVSGNLSLMTPSFIKEVDIERRAKRLSQTHFSWNQDTRDMHLASLNDGTYPYALEMADKSSAAFGLEARYPFFDQRLIEFCLSLPSNQKFAQGWNRVILRRAMEGILPPEIQWRPDKGNLSSNFGRKLLDTDRQTLDEVILSDSPALSKYISTPLMREAYGAYQLHPIKSQKESIQLFAAVNLALWLKNADLLS